MLVLETWAQHNVLFISFFLFKTTHTLTRILHLLFLNLIITIQGQHEECKLALSLIPTSAYLRSIVRLYWLVCHSLLWLDSVAWSCYNYTCHRVPKYCVPLLCVFVPVEVANAKYANFFPSPLNLSIYTFAILSLSLSHLMTTDHSRYAPRDTTKQHIAWHRCAWISISMLWHLWHHHHHSYKD